MRIAYLVDNNLGTVGGEQESTKIIISGMMGKGVNVCVFQPGTRAESLPLNIQKELSSLDRLKKVFKNPFLFSLYVYRLAVGVRKFSPDIVHSQAQVSFFIFSLLRMFRLVRRDSVFIHTERGIYSKYNLFFRRFFIFFMRELDVLVCTTETNKKLWSAALAGRKYKLDMAVIQNTAGGNFGLIENRSKGEGVRIGFAGRFCDWKNWPLAESIIIGLESKVPSLNVRMAVGCLDETSIKQTESMFCRLNSLIGKRFRGDINIPATDMALFYKDVDFFILTSNPGAESFGRTVVEAMSSGCIVFVTEGGGPPEVVGDPSFVFDGSESLVESISRLADNDADFSAVSARNSRRANDVYSLDANISKHFDMYCSIC